MRATDGQLVQRVLKGDREAFGELVDRYRDMAYGLGYHLTGEFEAARDLAQEAFIQAYLRLAQLRDPGRFAGWLRQIALNVHRSQLRRREVTTVVLEAEAQPVPSNPQPSEIEVVVREALKKLREPERLVLTLRCINGYSHREIGEFLGIRPDTVKTRLARARQHLKTEVMAMVEDTFEKKKLPDEFTAGTVEAALARAEEHLKRGRVGAALGEYETILQHDADHVPALLGMGMAQQAAGQDEDAVRQFRRVLELDPANQLAYGHLHQILGGQRDRFEELIALEEDQLKRHPEKAFQLHLSLGGLHTVMHQFRQAEDHLRQARGIRPETPYPLSELGRLLALQGRYDEADAMFEEAGPLYAIREQDRIGYEWDRFQLAGIRCAAGRYEQAIESVRPVFVSESETGADRIVERRPGPDSVDTSIG